MYQVAQVYRRCSYPLPPRHLPMTVGIVGEVSCCCSSRDKLPINLSISLPGSQTCFGCSNGIANPGHEPGARFVSGAGFVDDAVEFQP